LKLFRAGSKLTRQRIRLQEKGWKFSKKGHMELFAGSLRAVVAGPGPRNRGGKDAKGRVLGREGRGTGTRKVFDKKLQREQDA